MNSLTQKLASGIARLLPSGKQGDDPLVSLRAATRWLESLPIGDAFKCQQALYSTLKQFNETTAELTPDRLAIFMLLDEKSRDLQDTLVRQYLRNPRMSRLVESQLWHAVYGLNWEIARGYHAFAQPVARDTDKSKYEALIPQITLRAIRAFGQLLKWRAIRYLPASEKLWLRLHTLYRIAEKKGFNRRLLRAYSDDTAETRCETAYLHILMLSLANSGTLYPRQLDLLDRWLGGWQGLLQLDTQRALDSPTFVIDLSADHGPRRVRKPDADDTMVFWSTAHLIPKLQELHTALQQGSTPAQLGLTESARTTESLELLDHLIHHWSSLEAREQRRAPRATIKRLTDITHGLTAIITQLKTGNTPDGVSPYGVGLHYNEADDVHVYGFITNRTRERISQLRLPPVPRSPDVERWVMHDESECGYGAIVESRDKDWLRVGALIGIKSHESDTWQIGMVRRLSHVDSDTSSVGIETLTGALTLSLLHDISPLGLGESKTGNSADREPHSGLFLVSHAGAYSVIIDPVHFVPGKKCQVQGIPDISLITLGNVIERSEGWIRVAAEPTRV